jgi:flavin-dependent dehydrogenase
MTVEQRHEDVVIIGGGPSGSAAAMFLQREGIRAHILEEDVFPRFHIGESMTGAAGQVLRELGLGDAMYAARHPNKRGVNVYGASAKGAFWVPVSGRDESWKLFPWDTWHIRRSVFDKFMLDEAIARGATFEHAKVTAPIKGDDGAVLGVRARKPDGTPFEIRSKIVLDCSGSSTFLANAGVTGPKYVGNYDKQIAIFGHVKNTIRGDGSSPEQSPDNTLILYKKKFHWAWFIPIDHEVVSVGIGVPAAYFKEKGESPDDFFVRELAELHPELARRVPDRTLLEPVRVIPNYSYQVRGFCGRGFICIGDAHRFIDPIFSFGLTIGLREAQFVAPIVREYLEGKRTNEQANPFADHQLRMEKGIDCLEDTIDFFWEQPLGFAYCVHHRYREEMIDLFAGRLFEHQPSAPVLEFRKILGRDRERDYLTDGEYSIPIGSRYHKERAPIWQAEASSF